MSLKKVIVLIAILIIQTSYIYASQSISIGYEAKYRNFENFEYVNADAKKVGRLLYLLRYV